MGNLTYLAVTILKRDKRTILNAIMMLFCFCGINLIMLLYKICGLAKEFSNAPYIERLMEVFSLLVIIMFIATIIVLLLVMLGSIKAVPVFTGCKSTSVILINSLFISTAATY